MDDLHLPELIPGPSDRRIALRVSPAAERQLRAGHPWLFDGAIREQSRHGRAGDLGVVFDRKGRFLAVGLYDPGSALRLRVLQSGSPATLDQDWFTERIATAARLRLPLPAQATTGFRIVHGENDGLPGLVLDRYGRSLVLKLYTAAWVPHLPVLLHAIHAAARAGDAAAVLGDMRRIVLRLSRDLEAQADLLHGLADGLVVSGTPLAGPVTFLENGLTFEADLALGQKTGFFLDQRENRARVGELSGGLRVLNVFAYTGGFSLYAARGGATHVVSSDLSQPALSAVLRHFELNRADPAVAACGHAILPGDAFRVLQQLADDRARFDMLIVDPPAFARRQGEVPRALGAYARLTRLALGVLRSGGTLVASSCSSRVTADQFYATVLQSAVDGKRSLQEIIRTGHALDHPIGFPEGAYLKTLFAVAP